MCSLFTDVIVYCLKYCIDVKFLKMTTKCFITICQKISFTNGIPISRKSIHECVIKGQNFRWLKQFNYSFILSQRVRIAEINLSKTPKRNSILLSPYPAFRQKKKILLLPPLQKHSLFISKNNTISEYLLLKKCVLEYCHKK